MSSPSLLVTGASGPLLGDDEDDELLLDINQSELNIIDLDLQSSVLSINEHNNDQVAMVSVADNETPLAVEQHGNHLDVPYNHLHNASSSHDDSNYGEVYHHHGNSRENVTENQEIQEPNNLDEAEAQRMLEALVGVINNHGDMLSLENIVNAVNAQNMDDYLSIWHVQEDHNIQDHRHDNSNQLQVARHQMLEERQNEEINHGQQVARIPSVENQEAPIAENHDNPQDDLLVIVQNNIQELNDVIDHHDDAMVVDFNEDANRRVVREENHIIEYGNFNVDDADEMFDINGNRVIDHHGDEAVFDLRDVLNRDGAGVAVPSLDLNIDPGEDPGKNEKENLKQK